MAASTEAQIRAALADGPLVGSALQEATGLDAFPLWKASVTAPGLLMRRVGRRYLRFDRTVEGLARMSPSILREFLTYTVVGLADDKPAVEEAQARLAARIRVISRTKLRTATRVVDESIGSLVRAGTLDPESFCALVGGDIVYGMAHDVARRESSTGVLVEGSDLDVIVLVADEHAETAIPLLDEAIRARKWLYLRNPAFREEVDYVVKPLARLREQAAFASFTDMVACKVFEESELVYGSERLHAAGLRVLDEAFVPARLRELEFQAASLREDQESYLSAIDSEELPVPDVVKFYTDAERGEFEH